MIKVEDLGEYKVFIRVPGEKSEYDFFVWRAVFQGSDIIELKIPSHDDLGKMYLELKNMNPKVNENIFRATIRFIRDRWTLNAVIESYFNDVSDDVVNMLKRFLLTLKWIAIQEDAKLSSAKPGLHILPLSLRHTRR